jgi:hypothetical protein
MSTDKFGRYEIKSEIGRGGMATVFHANDPRFERDVAIKVLPREFLHDPQFRARFEREAKTIALLEHPAIVPVYDFGEEEGQPYIVMRYMSGGSMSEKISQGAVSLEETVQLFSRLAPALDAAHTKGVVHRDLKPGNILYDQYGNAFISDFGIARLAQATGTTLTGGNILGTPAYMSPEQIQGDKEIDGRSDIYAMGVILFQMLTGNAPYQSTTPARVMMMHILEPVPQILQAKKDLPVNIQTILDKAMAKEPDNRYNTMAEMSRALNDLLLTSTPPQGMATLVTPASSLASAEKTRIDARGSAAPAIGAKPAAKPQKKGFPLIGWILLAVIGLGLIGMIGGGGLWMAMKGRQAQASPTSMAIAGASTPTAIPATTVPATTLPTTAVPTNTEMAFVPNADTPVPAATETSLPNPTATQTLEPTAVALVIGGADKFTFINNNEIYVANVDGSGLAQITNDGTVKTRLQWIPPDYQNISFITGKCIRMVKVETSQVDNITCFENAAYLDDFQVSPDGKQVAISMDHEDIFIVPFDLAALEQAKNRGDLAPMGSCEYLSPYDRATVKTVQWSADGNSLAFVFQVPVGGRPEDNVRVINVAECVDPPRRVGVEFPAQFFDMKGYNANPTINNIGWDGEFLFALNSVIRNNGYGYLYFWNTENKIAKEVNPINNSCCYRDTSYSPDSHHIIFAYQALEATNKIQLFYIPFGTIGTGEKYSPLPLPDDFFPNRTDSPQPVLRPAK